MMDGKEDSETSSYVLSMHGGFEAVRNMKFIHNQELYLHS